MTKVKEGGYYVFKGIEGGYFTIGKTYRFSTDNYCEDDEIVTSDDTNGAHYVTPKWLKENFDLVGGMVMSKSPTIGTIKLEVPLENRGVSDCTAITYWGATPSTTEFKESSPRTLQEGDTKNKADRFNEGKPRFDLVNPWAHEQMVKVLTAGSKKYAERNWEKGLNWTGVIASLKRHLSAIESGEDFDKETGELHIAHVACNAHFLTAYYKIYPQGDDRPHSYLTTPKIGLDIDEVICDWVGAWTKKYGIPVPKNWSFDPDLLEKFESLREKGELDDFYLGLQPLIKPEDIPFEPHCYITSRPVSSEVTEKWLAFWGFPARPVFTTTKELSKVDIAKREGIEIFIDDNFSNFSELNKAGVCCFLMDAAHNQRYDIGFKRIKKLKDLM